MASKALTAIRVGMLSPRRTHLPESPFGPWHVTAREQAAEDIIYSEYSEFFYLQADFLMAETTPYKEKSLEMKILSLAQFGNRKVWVWESRKPGITSVCSWI